MERGVDFTVPRLYVPDGCRAPTAAIRRHAGDAACIQRCQVHERRNVLDHLPEQHQPSVERKLNTAYSMVGYQDGPQLGGGNGGDLDSGKLSVPEPLRKSLASANIIESAFSVVETACHLVKRWREGDHREHCLAPALLTAESKFRRTKGYREIPRLMDSPAKMQQFR